MLLKLKALPGGFCRVWSLLSDYEKFRGSLAVWVQGWVLVKERGQRGGDKRQHSTRHRSTGEMSPSRSREHPEGLLRARVRKGSRMGGFGTSEDETSADRHSSECTVPRVLLRAAFLRGLGKALEEPQVLVSNLLCSCFEG